MNELAPIRHFDLADEALLLNTIDRWLEKEVRPVVKEHDHADRWRRRPIVSSACGNPGAACVHGALRCARLDSLGRLGTDRVDLYILHTPDPDPARSRSARSSGYPTWSGAARPQWFCRCCRSPRLSCCGTY